MKFGDIDFLSVSLPDDVKREESMGNFKTAGNIIRRYLKRNINESLRKRLIYEMERMRRLKKEYPWERERAKLIMKREMRDFEDEELDRFISMGIVERMVIEGEERFFSRFPSNIFFLHKDAAKRRNKRDPLRDYTSGIVMDRIKGIRKGDIAVYRVRAGIKLRIKRRRDEKYRVWLPYPKLTGQIRRIKLMEAKPGRYYIADEDSPQRTIFFESSQREFSVEFEYEIEETSGGREGEVDGKFVEEKLPHIRFSPYLKSLAHVIGGEGDDHERARRIYQWITNNVNYSYVREYGTYENIGEFVATSLRGDCGMQAILFITLCRILGIPAKWQSGWFITPRFASPHDWAQVYVEDRWLPVDCSFGNKRHGKLRNEFYFGNLDAFRMIANDDFQVEFNPRKTHYRSDPVDNQRGEVETERRNVYYDGFSWEMYVKEFRRI